jgi:hypothetical protein
MKHEEAVKTGKPVNTVRDSNTNVTTKVTVLLKRPEACPTMAGAD